MSVLAPFILANLTIAAFNVIGMASGMRGPFVDWYLEKKGVFVVWAALIVLFYVIAGVLQ